MTSEPVRGWLVLSIVAVLCLVVPLPAETVETLYSRDMYPWLQIGFTSVSNLAPFAVLDALILIGIVLVVIRLWRSIFVARERGLFNAVWDLFRRAIRAVAILTILFLFAWGFNYRRPRLEATLAEGEAARPSVASLEDAFTAANVLAGRLRPTLVQHPDASLEALSRDLYKPFNTALTEIGRPTLSVPGRPKHSMFASPFFTKAGVDGMINPIALESILNPELLPFEQPFVLAHEWAHLAGQADEAEASAVGWLACMYGGPRMAYSASRTPGRPRQDASGWPDRPRGDRRASQERRPPRISCRVQGLRRIPQSEPRPGREGELRPRAAADPHQEIPGCVERVQVRHVQLEERTFRSALAGPEGPALHSYFSICSSSRRASSRSHFMTLSRFAGPMSSICRCTGGIVRSAASSCS